VSILVINAGSSSLKFSLFEKDQVEARAAGAIDWQADGQPATVHLQAEGCPPERAAAEVRDYASAVSQALQLLRDRHLLASPDAVSAVGHRVVHGGAHFRESVRIDPAVKAALAQLAEVAPLHNPPALAALAAAEAALPGVPQVAVFDTAFHATLPPAAFLYPVPYAWYEEWGVRRFGFHGISFAYCAGRAAQLLERPPAALRVVICHLGNGCSATAIRGGASVATTMGFTPLEGLMMGTRAGSVDPGALLYVQRQRGLSAAELDDLLNHHSGLLGVSGIASDYRSVEEAARKGHERARLALAVFAERVRAAIGALAVTLGGVDALVFTAGVGENSASLRATVCEGLACLGLRLDLERNGACRPDADVATADSAGRILVIHTREDLLIAREARRLTEGNAGELSRTRK
jgi:acetate kinase